jgi:hypothetical protein
MMKTQRKETKDTSNEVYEELKAALLCFNVILAYNYGTAPGSILLLARDYRVVCDSCVASVPRKLTSNVTVRF